jgi:hypothetical protein
MSKRSPRTLIMSVVICDWSSHTKEDTRESASARNALHVEEEEEEGDGIRPRERGRLKNPKEESHWSSSYLDSSASPKVVSKQVIERVSKSRPPALPHHISHREMKNRRGQWASRSREVKICIRKQSTAHQNIRLFLSFSF